MTRKESLGFLFWGALVESTRIRKNTNTLKTKQNGRKEFQEMTFIDTDL